MAIMLCWIRIVVTPFSLLVCPGASFYQGTGLWCAAQNAVAFGVPGMWRGIYFFQPARGPAETQIK